MATKGNNKENILEDARPRFFLLSSYLAPTVRKLGASNIMKPGSSQLGEFNPSAAGRHKGNILEDAHTFLLSSYLAPTERKMGVSNIVNPGSSYLRKVFGAPNDARLLARCHFTGPKKLSISRAQPPPICPRKGCCPHQKYKSITHGRINTHTHARTQKS